MSSLTGSAAVSKLTKTRFNIEANSLLRLKTLEGHIHEGTLMENPADMDLCDKLELINCWSIQKDQKLRCNDLRFRAQDLLEVRVLRYGPPKEKLDRLERTYSTMVVKSVNDFERLKLVLKDCTSVGLAFHGVMVGRFGTVGWVGIFCKNYFFMVDVISAIKEINNLWRQLEKNLFSEPKILKVVHNVRPIVDFLFHKHAIELKNVFDTQIADIYIQSHRKPVRKSHKDKDKERRKLQKENEKEVFQPRIPNKAPSLSDTLCDWLPKKMIELEIQILKKFEETDFTEDSPLMKRPLEIDENCKAFAVSIKYLLELKDILQEKLMSHYLECVNAQINFMREGKSIDADIHLGNPDVISEQLKSTVLQGNPVIK